MILRKMLQYSLLLGGVLLASPVLPGADGASPKPAAATAGKVDDNGLQAILSGHEEIEPVSEQTLYRKFHDDRQRLRDWYHREAGALRELLLGGCVILAVVLFGLLLIHRLKRRIDRDAPPGWHKELVIVLADPLLVLFGLVGIFLFLVPILRSLPACYTCDVRIFFTLIVLCVAWGGLELISLLSRHMSLYAEKDSNLDALMIEISRKLLKIGLFIVTFFLIGQSIFNLNLTTLLTGAGVAGLALAFASKETLANFFGTLVIIGDRPFRCGDRIQVNGIDGIVRSVGMRSTRVLTRDETVYTIPNSQLETSGIENISVRGVLQFTFTVGLVYETSAEDIGKAMKVLHEIVDDFHGKDAAGYRPRVFFDELGNSGLNLKVIMWLKTASFVQEENWRTEINLALIRRFTEENLALAYNTVTNYLCGDPARPLPVVWTGGSPPARN